MPPATKATLIVQMVISVLLVTSFVVADSFMVRLGIGAGALGIIAPVTIWQAARKVTKIGFDSGYIRAEADMLRAHCELQDD